jgi:hypothetical protein
VEVVAVRDRLEVAVVVGVTVAVTVLVRVGVIDEL